MAIPAKPASLLLATDLSARSDRALARAVQLASQWQARLVLLVAMADGGEFSLPNRRADADAGDDAPPPQTPLDHLREQGEAQLRELGVQGEVRVVVGKPGPAAIEAAAATGCGLIITGTSRSEVAMRLDPGSTLRWLARHATVPVLAVHDRVRGPYRHVGVASDYSQAATAALRLADAWFADAGAHDLLHGYDVPLSTLSLDDGPRAQALEVAQQRADEEARQHLVQALGDHAARWTPHAQLCGPVRMLREHGRETALDLTVIATHGRSALLDRLIGSVAERLLETVGTDLLVVRPPR